MAVKLAILKSGENIISEIKEGILDDKVVCYILNDPCKVVINGTYKILDNEEDNSVNRVSISLNKWPALSVDKAVQLPLDWVVTIVEPNEQLKSLYEEQVLEHERITNQSPAAAESRDSDS